MRWRRAKRVAVVVVALGGLLAVAVGMTDAGLQTTAGNDLIIVNARVADSRTTEVSIDRIVIEDGRIVSFGGADSPAPVYNAQRAWVVPGLIDTHVHILRAGYCGGDEGIAWDNVAQIPFNFDVALTHGNTTIVDLGGPLGGGTAIRDRLASEETLSPNYLVAGPILTAPGGYPLDWADHDLVDRFEVVFELETEASARRTIAHLAERGVDVVKIASMEVGYNEAPLPSIDSDVFRAAVMAAHEANLRVFVHAHTNAGYEAAIDAGADVIAHSTFEVLPDELIDRIVDDGIVIIPTLWVFAAFEHAREYPDILAELEPQLRPRVYESLADFHRRHLEATEELPPDFLPGIRFDRVALLMQQARDNLKRLHTAGATIAYGSDTSFCYALHGSPERELEQMVRAGLSPAAAFRAATIGSAMAIGREDLGRIEVGAVGDLLVLSADPRKDPNALRSPIAVVRGGRLIETRAEAPSLRRTLKIAWLLLSSAVF